MNTVMPRAKVLRQALGKTNIEEQRPTAMLTVNEACRSLRISKWTLYRLKNEGRLKTVKIGTRRLISAAAIARLITQLEAEEY